WATDNEANVFCSKNPPEGGKRFLMKKMLLETSPNFISLLQPVSPRYGSTDQNKSMEDSRE
ncbi:MAG: hypothetical protein ACLTWL_10715, partial [Eubacterium callanderi]